MFEDKRLLVTYSPHIRENRLTSKIMLSVVYALIPAIAVSIYYFGLHALRIYFLTIIFTLLFEALFLKIRSKSVSLNDNSALVTSLLLAMNLPPTSPWWLIMIGSFVAIIIGKQLFGGLGQNPFNPALVARVLLLIAWPARMNEWIMPQPIISGSFFDAVSTSTPLGEAKTEIITHGHIITNNLVDLTGSFLGDIGGSLGEVSALALILGGLFLLYRGIISWHIPVTYIISFLSVIIPYWFFFPDKTIDPTSHLFTGGLMLGVFFMATDMVTTPITRIGQIIFGIGCGLITAVIRLFGGYPEGVSFAILIMNAFVPLIDYYIRPKSFGESR